MKGIVYIAVLMMLALVGCSSEPPTQASVVNDDVIAEVAAGAISYQSNGLAATLNDLVAAGKGLSLRGDQQNGEVRVAESDSSFDSASRLQTIDLTCQRDRSDAYSEWELRYQITYAGVDAQKSATPRPVNPMMAHSSTNGTYRNARLTVQGRSVGNIRFDSLNLAGGVYLSGEYLWDGTSVVRADEARFSDVAIRCTWSRLYLVADPRSGEQTIVGRCDMNISANGPNGVISKNGTLLLDGGDIAILTIGAKRYRIDMRKCDVRRAV